MKKRLVIISFIIACLTSLLAVNTAISDEETGIGVTVTITEPVLESITVEPVTPTIPAGRTQQFSAIGTYSDTSTANINDSVTWSSSNTTVAAIDASGLVVTPMGTLILGTTVITASSGDVSGNTVLTVGPPVIESVTPTPQDSSVVFYPEDPPAIQFHISVICSNGIHGEVALPVPPYPIAVWASSNTSVATIDEYGLVTTVSVGNTIISVIYEGLTGNTTLTVLPDTVAPIVTVTSPADGQVFNDTAVTVNGTVNDVYASVNAIVNGGAPIPLSLNTVNFSENIALTPGSNTVLVTASDATGNIGTSGTITVTVDPNKPEVVIVQPAAGTIKNSLLLMVAGTVTGNTNSASLILNGESQSIDVTSGNFLKSVTLAEGENIITITAYTEGHEGESNYLGTSGLRRVILDTTPPVITIFFPVSGMVTSDPGISFFGSVDDPDISTVNVTVNDTFTYLCDVSDCNISGGIAGPFLVTGDNTITFKATDEAGNTATNTVSIIYDNTKPQVKIISPANRLVINDANLSIFGTVSDPFITIATLYINGTPRTIPVVPDSTYGTFSDSVILSAGVNTFEVTVADNAIPPNIGTSGVYNIELDNTPPVITIGLNDPTEAITITVKSNETLATPPIVTVNNTSVTMTQIAINKWSGACGCIASPIADGSYVVTAIGADEAGNITTMTATFCKQTISVADDATAMIQTDTTVVEFNTTTDVTDASVSVTQHLDNPSGNVGNPQGADMAAGAFVEIVASIDLLDNIEEVYIRVNYEPADLPAGVDESTLRLYLWDVTSGAWEPVPGSGVNIGEHYIYGTVDHLSIYGGFGALTGDSDGQEQGINGFVGGDGGGGGSRGVTAFAELMNPDGELMADVTAVSSDLQVYLKLTDGTSPQSREGGPIYWISIKALSEDETVPEPPEGSEPVMPFYLMEPAGATFEPPGSCTFKYGLWELPEGVDENNLVVMWWDSVNGQWVPLGGQVDPDNDTITVELEHLSLVTVMSSPRPAGFELSELVIIPVEVDIEEEVTVSIVVTNTGDISGNYDVILKINYLTTEVKTVTVSGGDSCEVSFTVSKDTAGTYNISIRELSGEFTVKAPPETTPIFEPTPEQDSTSESEAIPLDEAPSEPEPAPAIESTATEEPITETGIEVRWWLFTAIFCGIVVLGFTTWFVLRKRTSS